MGDVGFIFQCVLCGSYSVFAVDALDPEELALKASGEAAGQGHGHKVLQKDVHTAQQELLEHIQRRLGPSSEGEAAAAERYAQLPCPACTEITTGRRYTEWLDSKDALERPCTMSPHTPVTFEAGELPPAYLNKGGKWVLAQGVGPKDLELKLPYHLPAGQFRALLPPLAPPIRPLCWQKEGGEDPEPAEVWEERRALLDAVAVLLATPQADTEASPAPARKSRAAVASGAGAPGERAPLVGQVMPWLSDLLAVAEDAWRERRVSSGSGKKGPRPASDRGNGPRYVRVPLLRVADVVRPEVEAKAHA